MESAVGPVAPGEVRGVGPWAVGRTHDGTPFAVSRRCRHLWADLAAGTVAADGCLVCPWHGARYDVRTGRMTSGPKGIYARIPGLSQLSVLLSRVLPLRRRTVVERDGELYLED